MRAVTGVGDWVRPQRLDRKTGRVISSYRATKVVMEKPTMWIDSGGNWFRKRDGQVIPQTMPRYAREVCVPLPNEVIAQAFLAGLVPE